MYGKNVATHIYTSNHLKSISCHLVQLVINVLEADAHVCMHERMYVRVCIHTHTNTHTHARTDTHTHTHTHELTFHTTEVSTNPDAAAGQHLV